MNELARQAAFDAELERRLMLIGKFIPIEWIGLWTAYERHQQPRIVATPR